METDQKFNCLDAAILIALALLLIISGIIMGLSK